MARSLLVFFCATTTLAIMAGCGGTAPTPIPNSDQAPTDPSAEAPAGGDGAEVPSGSATSTKPDPGTPPKPTDPPAPNKPKRVFVTEKSYKGNLRDQAQATDGFLAGDKLCQTEAQASNLGGAWKAYLSGKVKGQALKATERLTEVGPWFLVDGTTKVFDGLVGLATMPLAKIDMLANGKKATLDQAWTGSKTGVAVGASCEDFNNTSWASSSSFKSGTNGNPLEIALWTDDGSSRFCDQAAPLYCFEQ